MIKAPLNLAMLGDPQAAQYCDMLGLATTFAPLADPECSTAVTPLFHDDLTDLALDASGTFTRASTAYHQQPTSGLWTPVASGEARFSGARRINTNLWYSPTSLTTHGAPISKSAGVTITGNTVDFTADSQYCYWNIPQTNTDVGVVGQYCRVTLRISAGTVTAGNLGLIIKRSSGTLAGTPYMLIPTASLPLVVTVCGQLTSDADGRRPYLGFETRAASGIPGVTTTLRGTISIDLVKAEIVDTLTSPPSEVSTAIGYAATAVGNTIAGSAQSGIVTEAQGAALPGPFGLLMEPATTNRLTYSNDLTNGAWTAATCTVAKDAVGIDGETNSACTLTATASDATVKRTAAYTAASATHATRWWIKRKTGTGTIELTLDNGATWQDVTSQINGTSYTGIAVDQASLTDPQVGIRIRTNGDAVYVGNTLLRAAAAKETLAGASPIFTTTAEVARAVDALSYTGVPADNETRQVVNAANVDIDDWNGTKATPTVPEVIREIKVYAPGGRPV